MFLAISLTKSSVLPPRATLPPPPPASFSFSFSLSGIRVCDYFFFSLSPFFFLKKLLFIYFWLGWVCMLRGLCSNCGTWVSHCSSSLTVKHRRVSGVQASAVAAPGLWRAASIVMAWGLRWHVASSRIRYWIRVSRIGRRILYHWATREAQWSDLSAYIINGTCCLEWYCFGVFNAVNFPSIPSWWQIRAYLNI